MITERSASSAGDRMLYLML